MIRMSKSVDPDKYQCFVEFDLGPSCLLLSLRGQAQRFYAMFAIILASNF